MLLSSFKANNEIFMVPIRWVPETWQFEHYIQIWQKSNMLVWLLNTTLLAVVVTLLQVLTGSFAAYGFSKIHFPGRNVLFLIYVATMAVPWQAYMIPQFKMLSMVGLNDTRWSIILLQAFGAFGVFMMKQFYDTIPVELSEAARLDGMSEFGIYWRVILPLSGSSIAALAIITFTNTWNDYMGPLLYLRSPDLYTIQLGLKTFISQYDADYSMIMTGSVLSVLPILLVFLVGQRHFVEGIATTGMKG
ncbi:carbohydrate ABC transporter permease [Bifidobacterium psychraerophilum]|uniref:carbohydrate ABC transporter permease n=1 Tax=Bifidobacterium psychraerophilum TaxID=218140 RepID=UPI0039E829CE